MGTTKTEIVKPEVKEMDSALALLKEHASHIVVTNQDEFREAGIFLTQCRAFKKRAKFLFDPFIEIAKTALNASKNELARYTDVADGMETQVSGVAERWVRQEKERAAEEERRVNAEKRRKEEAEAAERRKIEEAKAEAERKERQKEIEKQQKAGELKKKEAAALQKKADEDAAERKRLAEEEQKKSNENIQEVKVQPSVPTVAGIRRRVNYYAGAETDKDEDLLIAAFKFSGDTQRGTFLRRFICVNNLEVAKYAREVKDDEAVMKALPGVRAYHEDSV